MDSFVFKRGEINPFSSLFHKNVFLKIYAYLSYVGLQSICTLFFIWYEVEVSFLFYFFPYSYPIVRCIICRKNHLHHSSAVPLCPKSNVHIFLSLFLGSLLYVIFHWSISLSLPQIHILSFAKGLDYLYDN